MIREDARCFVYGTVFVIVHANESLGYRVNHIAVRAVNEVHLDTIRKTHSIIDLPTIFMLQNMLYGFPNVIAPSDVEFDESPSHDLPPSRNKTEPIFEQMFY